MLESLDMIYIKLSSVTILLFVNATHGMSNEN